LPHPTLPHPTLPHPTLPPWRSSPRSRTLHSKGRRDWRPSLPSALPRRPGFSQADNFWQGRTRQQKMLTKNVIHCKWLKLRHPNNPYLTVAGIPNSSNLQNSDNEQAQDAD
jgi:hypothetical protein